MGRNLKKVLISVIAIEMLLLAIPAAPILIFLLGLQDIDNPFDDVTVIPNPAGLGEVKFTRYYHPDQTLFLSIKARKSKKDSWIFIDRFIVSPGYSSRFREARWTADGSLLLIRTRQWGVSFKERLIKTKDGGEEVVFENLIGWEREGYTHAFDFRQNRVIVPRASSSPFRKSLFSFADSCGGVTDVNAVH